jgi:hypothetical protein
VKPRGSLPHPQEPPTCQYREPDEPIQRLGIPSGYFRSGFRTKILCARFLSLVCAARAVRPSVAQCGLMSSAIHILVFTLIKRSRITCPPPSPPLSFRFTLYVSMALHFCVGVCACVLLSDLAPPHGSVYCLLVREANNDFASSVTF